MAWVTKHSAEQWQPEAPRQYSARQKAANWWHYSKWWVLGAAVALLLAAGLVHGLRSRSVPDACVAVVCAQEPPQSDAEALQARLAALCPDANGDGQVLVEVELYPLDFTRDPPPEEMEIRMATVARLTGSVYAAGGAYLYLLEDPEGFQRMTGALCYLDGSAPAPDDDYDAANWENMTVPAAFGGVWDGFRLARGVLTDAADPAQAEAVNALWLALTK